MTFQARSERSATGWRAARLAACLMLGSAMAMPVATQAADKAHARAARFDTHNLDGAWDRYPQPGDGGLDPTTLKIPRPIDVGQPPLRPGRRRWRPPTPAASRR